MADLDAFRVTSVTFAGTTIASVQTAETDYQAQDEEIVGDGDPIVKGILVDDIVDEIEIEFLDVDHIADATLERGDNGSLVVVYEKRADGKGAASAGNKTATCGNTTIIGKTLTAGTRGSSRCRLRMKAASPGAGANPCTWS